MLRSWREDRFLPFVYCRRGLGLGLGLARSCPGATGSSGTEGLWLNTKQPGRNWQREPRLGVLGAPAKPAIYSLPGSSLFLGQWVERRELSLAGSIEIILNPLFSRKGLDGWEVALPGHSADIPGLNLLEQRQSLAVRCLNSSNLVSPGRGEETQ